jgi:calcineurin-like phosphoesterase family protein
MNTFLISDTHFGHEATCTKFTKPDGEPLRPFTNAEEMNEALVAKWNAVVGEDDIIYHLGDVVMSHRHLHIMGRLNGTKHLIAGNHDPLTGKNARKFNFGDYFETISSMKELSGMILTHVPIHPQSLDRWGVNVHGHLHAMQVMKGHGDQVTGTPDPRYLCISVEHTNFEPISLEDVKQRVEERRRRYA